jgi:hypothetical protein
MGWIVFFALGPIVAFSSRRLRSWVLGGAVPWILFVDLILALAPSADAHRLAYPFWDSMIVYWFTVGILGYADRWVMKRNWGVWRRVGIKIPILLGAEMVVSLGTLEACNTDLTSCHTVFF